MKARKKQIAYWILAKAEDNIRKMNLVDRDELLGSGKVLDIKDGIWVGFRAIHAPYVEEGTGVIAGHKPYFPDVTEIREWYLRVNNGKVEIRHKNGNIETVSATSKKGKKHLDGVIYAICKQIEVMGTEPRLFFKDAVFDARIKFGRSK